MADSHLDECLHERFEHQVDLTPGACAVVSVDEELTYAELDERANQFARLLQSKGVVPGDLVGLFCKRSVNAIVSILGILKSGAAYVPLDERWPDDRIAGILEEANVQTLVLDEQLSNRAKSTSVARFLVHDSEETWDSLSEQPVDRLPLADNGSCASDLCYIIYTSGTTGRPKGIMTEHRNVAAFARAFRETCEMTARDRVYQGFSLTFDGSVEEMWLALSSGASLIIGPPEFAQLGEETAQYMREKGVTLFSTVPTFLAMIQDDVPSLRLVVVSGEACPPNLIKRWVRNELRMLNVYGPTETTVNTTVWECVPDVPVTIGRPLPGYTIRILDEKMQPVPIGSDGELYIGGVGVARGYFNQPELTQKHFISYSEQANGHSETLYRTGDLVRELDNGELLFLGRIDGQVKVRGYRIELSEIESVLRDHPDVEGAAVSVVQRNGSQELAAFVVPAGGVECGLQRNVILDHLRRRLPAYMVPSYLDPIEQLPRLASGKVDRKSLPQPTARLVAEGRSIVPPRTETEKVLTDLWEQVFETSPISIDDDFFMDLGGDSLLAASFVSKYRNACGEGIAMREVYQSATVRKLAEWVDRQSSKELDVADPESNTTPLETAEAVFGKQPRWHRGLCYTFQSLALLVFYGIPTATILLLAKMYVGAIAGELPFILYGSVVLALFILAYPSIVGVSILAKWVIIGRYRAGSYPLWGLYYFRWWLAARIQRASGIGLVAGTPLINLYYRLMGAKIGRGCVVNTGHCTAFDLVSIGDGSCIGSEAQLLGYTVSDGMLHIGTIEVGRDCFVGIQSALAINSEMGDGARLDDLSLLGIGEKIPAGESRQGSPSRPCSVLVPDIRGDQSVMRRSVRFGVLSYLSIYAVQLFMLAAMLPNLILLNFAYAVNNTLLWAAVLAISIPLFEITFWILHIVVKACVLRRSQPGVYRIDSFYFLRKWYVDTLMGLSRLFTLPLYTTLYMPPLLRMLGAKIGPRAELSVIAQLAPDLVEMEEESFFADGSIIGGMRVYRGHFELAFNRIGRRSFLGNSAVLPVGASIGSQCLLGVLSSPPSGTVEIPDQTEWLGAPSFALPHRKKVEGFEDSQIYKPSKQMYALRLCVDALRIITASSIEILGVVGLIAWLSWALADLSLGMALATAPFVGIALAGLMVFGVVGAKQLMMGTYEPVIKPLWSPYVWLNEVINGAHESVAAPLVTPLLGTPFFAAYLQLMGCKVGKHAFIETTLFGEFDLVQIGDHVALNPDVVIQNHLFEDRIFKSARLIIGDNCSIGNMSVVLYDSEMGEGSSIGSLSLLMKGESIPPHTQWVGVPISRVPSSNAIVK
ncbi:Pls/PosA family non-ribosomal peptide synthetase [Novipirellula aureliae]|nr:Pls/PosA family non-ribosomal peptide synthetase [Novipirellula aureliae]